MELYSSPPLYLYDVYRDNFISYCKVTSGGTVIMVWTDGVHLKVSQVPPESGSSLISPECVSVCRALSLS